MQLNLANKRVLITGGSRGIGKAIVESFVAEGAHVAFCARQQQQVEACMHELERANAQVVGSVVDVADQARLKEWITQSAERLGGLDILIANPSGFGMGTTTQDWQVGYQVDLLGTVHAVETALPHLLDAVKIHGDASILILSSAAVAEADSDSAYGVYKAGLIHYTKGLARRLADRMVRVNAISPGTIFVENGFWDHVRKNVPSLYEHYFKRNPMGRMGSPQEIACAALFLCSSAASFITGANLVVDGGLTARVNY